MFQKLREAALAYHLERQWSKDKILTEYLNEIYFGEGATGIEAAAQTYFGYNHPGCGEGDDRACASELLPWEAALLAGIISSPSAYSPRGFPENAKTRRDQVLANMRDEGYITPEEYAAVRRRSRSPTTKRSDAAGRELRRAVLHLVAAPAAGRPLRRRRGVRRRAPDPLDPRPRAPEPGPGRSPSRPWRGFSRPPPSVVLDNETGGVLAMVGGLRLSRTRRSTWRPTATASPDRRSSRSPWSPRSSRAARPARCSPRPRRRSRSGSRCREKNGNGDKVVNDALQGQQLQRLLPRLGLDRERRPPTRTTPSTRSSAPRSGSRTSPRRRSDGDRDRPLDRDFEYSINDGPWQPYNPALILGGLETGVTPLEMAHAYNTLAADGQPALGHDGGRAPAARSGSSRSPTATIRGDATRRRPGPRPDRRRAATTSSSTKPGDRPDRRPDRQGRALDRGHLGHRCSAPRTATRPGARPGPPTTTATPGSAARRRRSPPASGSATATPSPRWRPSSPARRSTAGPSRR